MMMKFVFFLELEDIRIMKEKKRKRKKPGDLVIHNIDSCESIVVENEH